MFHSLCSIFWSFNFLFLLYQLMIYFYFVVCSTFHCTCWRLSCIFIDYSGVISLFWTTHDFYPWIEGFFTLNKSSLFFFNFYFALYILFVLLTGSYKFGGIYFHYLLLYYRVCYCVGLFPIRHYSIIEFVIVLAYFPHQAR